MTWERSLQAALRDLKRQEAGLKSDLAQVQHKIKQVEHVLGPPAKSKTRLSPEGREAISRAAKKRWAEYRRKQHRGAKARRSK